MGDDPKVRVAIAGAVWLDALKSTWIADNEHLFEQRRFGSFGRGGSQYVAILHPRLALLMADALEAESRTLRGADTHQRRTSLERSVIRIRAECTLLGYTDG